MCGFILNILEQLDLVILQKIVNLMMILLMSIGLYRYIKGSKKSLRGDKILSTQKPVKVINYVEDPTGEGEDLGKLLEETTKGGRQLMKKLKDILIWVWGNKAQIADGVYVLALGVISNIIIYSDLGQYLFPKQIDNLWVRVVITIISVIMTIISWIDTATNRKFDSVETLINAQKQKEIDKTNNLMNAEQRDKCNKLLSQYQTKANELTTKLNEIDDKISVIKTAIELGTSTENDERVNLYNLSAEKDKVTIDLETQNNHIKIVKDKLNNLK